MINQDHVILQIEDCYYLVRERYYFTLFEVSIDTKRIQSFSLDADPAQIAGFVVSKLIKKKPYSTVDYITQLANMRNLIIRALKRSSIPDW